MEDVTHSGACRATVPAPLRAASGLVYTPAMPTSEAPLVRHFRHILLWPLQLDHAATPDPRPWRALERAGGPWRASPHVLARDAETAERQYKEFISFLPYVQRLFYGERRGRPAPGDAPTGLAPMRVYRRDDVAGLRLVLRPGDAPLTLAVEAMELVFFQDTEVVMLRVEVSARDLPWPAVLDYLHRHGRAYPSGWDHGGMGVHNSHRTEWLAADGTVLAASDAGQRERFLDRLRSSRAPGISAHWAWLLRPLAMTHYDAVSDEDGAAAAALPPAALRCRLLEYHRMPTMACLALDDPHALERDDFVRLGLVTALRADDPLPRRDPQVQAFESLYCDDRYWADEAGGPATRMICTGNTLMVVGRAGEEAFEHPVNGLAVQFRHQFALAFQIAHFHRAALLVFSDRMMEAVNELEPADPRSQRRFHRRVRHAFEAFLRFTHRYWFHELSERVRLQSLYERCSRHLGNDAKYLEIKEEIRDMSQYLEADTQRRQSNTVVRLTVVTAFGLIGSLATGFLGMNLIDETRAGLWERVGLFALVFAGATALTLLTVARSKPLSDFLEALSEGRFGWRALSAAWRRGRRR